MKNYVKKANGVRSPEIKEKVSSLGKKVYRVNIHTSEVRFKSFR